MNEKEFREALLRIAIKGKKIFNKIAESLALGLQPDSKDM